MLPWIVSPRTSSDGFLYACENVGAVGDAVNCRSSSGNYSYNDPRCFATQSRFKNMRWSSFIFGNSHIGRFLHHIVNIKQHLILFSVMLVRLVQPFVNSTPRDTDFPEEVFVVNRHWSEFFQCFDLDFLSSSLDTVRKVFSHLESCYH